MSRGKNWDSDILKELKEKKDPSQWSWKVSWSKESNKYLLSIRAALLVLLEGGQVLCLMYTWV